MSAGYNGLPAYYFQSSDPITPNFGLSLKGTEPDMALNLVLIDSAIASATTPPSAPSGSIQFNNAGAFGGSGLTTNLTALATGIAAFNAFGAGANATAGRINGIVELGGYPPLTPYGFSAFDICPSLITAPPSDNRSVAALSVGLAAQNLPSQNLFGVVSEVTTPALFTGNFAGDWYAVYGEFDHNGSGNFTNNTVGLAGFVFNNGTGNLAAALGVHAEVQNFGAGSMSVVYASYARSGGTAGTIGTDYSVEIDVPHTGATFTNPHAGLHIEDQTNGGVLASALAILVEKGKSLFKDALTLDNPTAATSGTSQSSPIFTLSGRYWTGSASATDSWTVQDVVGNGTNGTSTVTLAHSGSTGAASLSVGGGLKTSGAGPTNSGNTYGQEIHVPNQNPFAAGFFNDTYSPSIYGVAYYIDNSGNFFLSTGATNKSLNFCTANYNVPALLISNGNTQLPNNVLATALVSQSSPTLTLSGTYWTGSASAADSWTLQDVVGNGTNGTSVFTLTHAGTSGSSWFSISPGMSSPSVIATNFFGMAASFTSTASLGISASALIVSMGSSWVLRWTNAANWNNTADIGLSRISAGVLGVGNATQGDISGTISAATAILNGLTSPVEAAPLEIASNASGIGFLIQRTATDYTDFVSGGVVKGIRGGGSTATPMIVGNASASLTVYSGTGTVFVSGNPATPAGDSTGNLSCFNITEVNAVAATSGTSQSSPTHTFSGQYWTGSASATDSWTVQDVVGNGTNGTSVLTFAHSGTTGQFALGIPDGTSAKPSLVFTADLTTGISRNSSAFWVSCPQGFVVTHPGNNSSFLTAGSGGSQVASIDSYGWSSGNTPQATGNDTSISRSAAGVVSVNTTTANNAAGNLQLNNITKYNAETTAGPGVAYIRGSTLQRSETGADANLLTVTPASATGSYRLTFRAAVSTATTLVGFGWTATWTDSNGASQAPTNLAMFQSGVAAPTLTGTAVANYYGEAIIDVNNAGTNIVVKVTFTSGTLASLCSATIERIA